MVEINAFLQAFIKALDDAFGARVYFVGLQGSYGRGEATQSSDIDLAVILSELTAEDIYKYGSMLDTLPHRELVCGFLAGKDELLSWEPSDLFQFYYDTTPIKGSLDEILPLLDRCAVERAVKIGVCNIYHGCVHNMLHEKSEDILKGLYKSASFTVQAIAFLQNGSYVKTQSELLSVVSPEEKTIIENFLSLKRGEVSDFDKISEELFAWAQNKLN